MERSRHSNATRERDKEVEENHVANDHVYYAKGGAKHALKARVGAMKWGISG